LARVLSTQEPGQRNEQFVLCASFANTMCDAGSHRAGAGCAHPTLRPTASLRDRGGTNGRLRQRMTRQQPEHCLPRDSCLLRAAAQPLPPYGNDMMTQVEECPEVSGDTEIPKMPQQLSLECCPTAREPAHANSADTTPRYATSSVGQSRPRSRCSSDIFDYPYVIVVSTLTSQWSVELGSPGRWVRVRFRARNVAFP
jgi:hypothetical protein